MHVYITEVKMHWKVMEQVKEKRGKRRRRKKEKMEETDTLFRGSILMPVIGLE